MPNIPLRKGMLIRHQNHVYVVMDFSERHTGKQKPTVHVALRDLRDHHPVDRSLDEILPVEEVQYEYRRLQYLYAKGERRVFMDAESFEEYELTAEPLHGKERFLVDGTEYRAMFLESRPVLIEVPEIVSAKVALTAAPSHSVGATANITKEATLENRLTLQVPLFIKTGDLIRVDTRTKTYAGKESG